jgi:hypothetical protein
MSKTIPSFLIDLTVSHNEVLADLLQANNEPRLNEIIRAARSTLHAGGQVIFQETYSATPNMPPAVVRSFRTLAELEVWISDTNKMRQRLSHSALGGE